MSYEFCAMNLILFIFVSWSFAKTDIIDVHTHVAKYIPSRSLHTAVFLYSLVPMEVSATIEARLETNIEGDYSHCHFPKVFLPNQRYSTGLRRS